MTEKIIPTSPETEEEISNAKDLEEAWLIWLKTRPKNVQDFAHKHQFKPGDKLEIGNQEFYFMGFSEDDNGIGIIFTPINPVEDYDAAVDTRKYLCSDHFELTTFVKTNEKLP